MESRLFLDSSVADIDRGKDFASFSFFLRPPLDLRPGGADFYAALRFLQIPLEDILLTDTVTLQLGREGLTGIIWDEKVHRFSLSARDLQSIVNSLKDWFANLGIDIELEYGTTKKSRQLPFCSIRPGDRYVRLSPNICRALGFRETVFEPEIETTANYNASFERWLPGPLFCHIDCLEERGLHATGSECQFVSGKSTASARRDSYLMLVDFHRGEWSGMPAEVLSVAPEGALQWIRTARKELSRIVLSLRHANGDIIRVRPDSFYLTAEIAFKRRLAVTFD